MSQERAQPVLHPVCAAAPEPLRAAMRSPEAVSKPGRPVGQFCAWSYDVRSDLFEISPEASEIFGLSGDELEPLTFVTFLERIHPDDRPKLVEAAHGALVRRLAALSYRYRVLGKEGRAKPVVGHAHCEFDPDGTLRFVHGAIMDVSEQERYRRRVELANARIEAVSESVTVWWWKQDEQFRFTTITPVRDENVAVHHAAMLGRRRWDLPDAQPCNGTWDEHRRLHEARQPFHGFEFRCGSAYFSATGVPVYSTDGSFVGYRGTGHDITALKLAEAAAREGEALLHLASRLGRVGAWSFDEQTRRGTWSGELLGILELPPCAELTPDALLRLVEPGWSTSVGVAIRRCRRRGVSAHVELRARTAKGRLVWLHLMVEPVRDASGAIRRIQGAVQDVTDRRQDAVRLRQVSEDLAATFESITDALITVDKGLRCTYANGEAENLTRLPRQALLGRPLREVVPFLCGAPFQQELQRVHLSGCGAQIEAHDEASCKWFSVTLCPSGQGVTLIIRDVTQSRIARDELARSEERYRLLFETNADAIVKADAGFGILHANRAACRMFGRSLQQLYELRTLDLVCPSDGRLGHLVDERLRTGGAVGELVMLRADGSTFDAEVSTSVYLDSSGESFYNLVIRDATERVRLRRRLEAVNEELASRVRERTLELEGANNELKAFARSVAHDLRQPITATRAFAVALGNALDKGNTLEAQRHAVQVVVSARTMGDYVEAVLSLAHISQASLDVDEVDLSAVADALLDELQGQAPERKLVRDLQPGMCTEGDVALLRMLLQNLLGNAWKFTSRTEVARISFGAEQSPEGDVVYCVRDNGAGFDMARADRLFGSFQRLHDAADFPGTGIGLANAHRIVARHGGRIWAQAAPGLGAVFRFTLRPAAGPQSRVRLLRTMQQPAGVPAT